MKTIVEKATKQSKYLLSDLDQVVFESGQILLSKTVIADLNIETAMLVENVTPPEDWVGCKYLYDAGAWTLNPSWEEPTQPA